MAKQNNRRKTKAKSSRKQHERDFYLLKHHHHPIILFLLKASHFFYWSFHVVLPDFVTSIPSAKLHRKLFFHTKRFSFLRKLTAIWLVLSISFFSIAGYQVITAPVIKAANATFPFDVPGNFTFDTNRISVNAGIATLQAIDQIDDDNTATGFAGGIFADTEFSLGQLQLDPTGLTNGTGTFTSRIIDAGGDVAWSTLGWSPQRPHQKNLPNNGATETGYSTGNITMSGNLVLLHADETAGATTFIDSSGNNENYTCTVCPVAGTAGRFNTALDFSGGENVEDADGEDYLNGLTAFSIATWIKSDVIGTDRGFFIANDPDGSDAGLTIRYDDAGVNGGGDDVIKAGITTTAGATQIESSSNVQTTEWQHVVLTWTSGSAMSLYINGALDTPSDAGAAVGGSLSTLDRAILGKGGKDDAAGSGWQGLMDEFSLFNRALTPMEVQDHYLRGASRLDIQLRSCNDAICDTEQFIGPDGTTGTTYNDGLNTADALPSAIAITSLPNNRYFQYQVVLDADDNTNTPQSSSFSFLPAHNDAGGPSIQNAAGITYTTSIDTFTETVGGGNTGSVSYQISNNGTNFYYFNGLNWVAAASQSQSNPAGTVGANISTFATDVGVGDFFFRAFLQSSLGLQQVELDQIEITFDSAIDNSNDGGGSSLFFFSQPSTPPNGFAITINEESTVTQSQLVSLTFNVGSDTTLVELSNEPDFLESITLSYASPLNWDLCSVSGQPQSGICEDEDYTVYARFYKSFGQAHSNAVSDSITLLSDFQPEEDVEQPSEPTSPSQPDSEQTETPTNTEESEIVIEITEPTINESLGQEPQQITEQETNPLLPAESTEEPTIQPQPQPSLPAPSLPVVQQPIVQVPVPAPTPIQQQTPQTITQITQEIGSQNYLLSTTIPQNLNETDKLVLTFTSGSLTGQSLLIDKYVANQNGLLLFTPLQQRPAIGDQFQVFNGTLFESETFVSPAQQLQLSPLVITNHTSSSSRALLWFVLGLLIIVFTGICLFALVLYRLWKQSIALTTMLEHEHHQLFEEMKASKKRK